MVNSLGLDDDLDGVELVQDLEKAFDISIADSEAEQILTVGQLYDLLLSKFPADETHRKCASAMAFYRLRRAIKNLDQDTELNPSTDLTFLEARGLKATFRKIQEQSELRLPRLGISVGASLGCLGVALLFAVAGGASKFFQWGFLSEVNGFEWAGAFVAVAWAILYFDDGKLPKNCSTLGGFTKQVAAMNYGRLIRVGASHRDIDIWNNLLELLSSYALPKSEITRDTFFLQSQLKK